jgi:hypothetical protein
MRELPAPTAGLGMRKEMCWKELLLSHTLYVCPKQKNSTGLVTDTLTAGNWPFIRKQRTKQAYACLRAGQSLRPVAK